MNKELLFTIIKKIEQKYILWSLYFLDKTEDTKMLMDYPQSNHHLS